MGAEVPRRERQRHDRRRHQRDRVRDPGQGRRPGANVRVLSNSWGGGGFSQALLDEINKANANDMLFVAAAGNNGREQRRDPVLSGQLQRAERRSRWRPPTTPTGSRRSRTTARRPCTSARPASTSCRRSRRRYVRVLSAARRWRRRTCRVPRRSCCPGARFSTANLKTTILNNVDVVASLSGTSVTGGRLNVDRAMQSCREHRNLRSLDLLQRHAVEQRRRASSGTPASKPTTSDSASTAATARSGSA